MSLDEIRKRVSYDPETGIFRWLISKGGQRAGDVAGHVDRNGYRGIRINGRYFLASHLAWFFMRGELPPGVVDHKNLNTSDDRWQNLRLATHGQNHANAPVRKNNTSGYKGVCFLKKRRRWAASIAPNRKHIRLGQFPTAEEAARAYDAAAIKYFGEFARLNFPLA